MNGDAKPEIASQTDDWAARNASWMIGWGVPAIALAAAAFSDLEMLVWAPMLTWMGIACLINARRCGRMHCHFTGPFFLLMALLSLLYGTETLSLGEHGWAILGAAIAIGWLALHLVPERLWGRYRGDA